MSGKWTEEEITHLILANLQAVSPELKLANVTTVTENLKALGTNRTERAVAQMWSKLKKDWQKMAGVCSPEKAASTPKATPQKRKASKVDSLNDETGSTNNAPSKKKARCSAKKAAVNVY